VKKCSLKHAFATTLFSIASLAMLGTSQLAYADDELVVYSSRKEHLIKPLFDQFTKETGIPVTLQTGKANALIERLKAEGERTQADIFMTVDAGNLWYAAQQGLFQPMNVDRIQAKIPAHLRDPDNLWTGLSVRARTIVYHSERVQPSELSSYEALADNAWHGKLCLRTSKKVYNKSLVAAMIDHDGATKTEQVLTGWVSNLAAKPQAKDSQVLKAIEAGQCDVGIVNTYYYGRMQDKNPQTKIKLFWANQNSYGTHINVSGAGILKHAQHREAAQKLLNWLASDTAQKQFGGANKEYPANPKIPLDPQVASWGSFKADDLNLAIVGKRQAEAVKLMQKANYK
jgi:iron(III) transport system substrate-binding protein